MAQTRRCTTRAEALRARLNWSNKEDAAGVEKGERCVKVSHWLAPGQMEVYRVARAK